MRKLIAIVALLVGGCVSPLSQVSGDESKSAGDNPTKQPQMVKLQCTNLCDDGHVSIYNLDHINGVTKYMVTLGIHDVDSLMVFLGDSIRVSAEWSKDFYKNCYTKYKTEFFIVSSSKPQILFSNGYQLSITR